MLEHSHKEEFCRLSALHNLDILDTEPEADFESVVRFVCELLDVPVCLISLIDETRQWFKAKVGLGMEGTAREQSLCSDAMHCSDVMVIEDASQHPKYKDYQLVTGEPHLRFYAGAPLFSPDGYPIGALCAISNQPRKLSDHERKILLFAANEVNTLIASRKSASDLSKMLVSMERIRVRMLTYMERFEIGFEAAPYGIAMVCKTGEILRSNRMFAEILGLPSGEVVGRKLWNALNLTLGAEVLQVLLRAAAEGEKIHEVEVQGNIANGDLRTFATSIVMMPDQDGVESLMIYLSDITSRKRSEDEFRKRHERICDDNDALDHVSNTDALTDLNNRRRFDTVFAEWIHAYPEVTLILLDVDHFKKFNDEFGHQCGDEVLRSVATCIKQSVRPTDLACRYGGEEFAVLLPGQSLDKATEVAERIATKLRSYPWQNRNVTASFGIATASSAHFDIESMVKYADIALYAAKAQGRDRVIGWSEDLPNAA